MTRNILRATLLMVCIAVFTTSFVVVDEALASECWVVNIRMCGDEVINDCSFTSEQGPNCFAWQLCSDTTCVEGPPEP